MASGGEDEEVIRLEGEAANFEEPEASMMVTESCATITNVLTDTSVAVKMKCTDLEHFAVRPATALIRPKQTLDLNIERRPHKTHKDQKIEIHYIRLPANDQSPSNINQLFKKKADAKRPPDFLTLLLRVPRKGTLDKANNFVGTRPRPHPPKPRPDEEATQRTAQRSPPPPLELSMPGLRCFFFPPFTQASEVSFSARNPGASRVAVKLKVSDLVHFSVHPSYLFLAPGATEELVVRRSKGEPEEDARPERLDLYAVSVSFAEGNWKRVWDEAGKDETSSVSVDLDVRNQPYLHPNAPDVLFHKPHSVKTLAGWTMQNVSPFHCIARVFIGDPTAVRVNPARCLIEPLQSKDIAFSASKVPGGEMRVHVDYCKVGEDDRKLLGADDLHSLKMKKIFDNLLDTKKEKVMAVYGTIKAVDVAALDVSPAVADLKREDGCPHLTAFLSLQNRASAHLAFKVRALHADRYTVTPAKGTLEPGQMRELAVTDKLFDPAAVPAAPLPPDSSLKVECAFTIAGRKPEHIIAEAKTKNPNSVIQTLIPISYPRPDSSGKDDNTESLPE